MISVHNGLTRKKISVRFNNGLLCEKHERFHTKSVSRIIQWKIDPFAIFRKPFFYLLYSNLSPAVINMVQQPVDSSFRKSTSAIGPRSPWNVLYQFSHKWPTISPKKSPNFPPNKIPGIGRPVMCKGPDLSSRFRTFFQTLFHADTFKFSCIRMHVLRNWPRRFQRAISRCRIAQYASAMFLKEKLKNPIVYQSFG